MKVLVIGATGFVGMHLVPQLLLNGYSVTCLVRAPDRIIQLSFKNEVSFIIGDITDPTSLVFDNDFTYVIHLAALGHVSAISNESYNEFVNVNEIGTRNLINALIGCKTLKLFIHFSSTAAMGPNLSPILSEKSTPNPRTPYQLSKYKSELVSLDAFSNVSFPVIILRPCMIYGIGGKGEFLRFCKLMNKGIFPKVGNGSNLTPIVHVNDVVNATLLAMINAKAGNTYIIASANSYPLDVIRKYVVDCIDKPIPYIYVPVWVAMLGSTFFELMYRFVNKAPIVTRANIRSTVTNRTFDISKAINELGYKPEVSLYDGINNTVKWYIDNNLL